MNNQVELNDIRVAVELCIDIRNELVFTENLYSFDQLVDAVAHVLIESKGFFGDSESRPRGASSRSD